MRVLCEFIKFRVYFFVHTFLMYIVMVFCASEYGLHRTAFEYRKRLLIFINPKLCKALFHPRWRCCQLLKQTNSILFESYFGSNEWKTAWSILMIGILNTVWFNFKINLINLISVNWNWENANDFLKEMFLWLCAGLYAYRMTMSVSIKYVV